MPNKVYTREVIVNDTEIDFTGRMTMQALMALCQNIAGLHASSFGLGFEKLQSMNLAWVLVKSYIRIKTPPVRGQRIKIITWPGKTRRCFYPRYFVVESMEGERLCDCATHWVVINTKTRDLYIDRENLIQLPDTSELEAPVELPKRLKIPEKADEVLICSPKYSEIDINLHLNNTKYLTWICDMVGSAHFEKHHISQVYIVYANEIRPHDVVTLSRYHGEGNDIFHGINQEGLSCFHAQIHWSGQDEPAPMSR